MSKGQITYFYSYDWELGRIEASTYCDTTCTGTCDGHEVPGYAPRCHYCWWKPCNCDTMLRNEVTREIQMDCD